MNHNNPTIARLLAKENVTVQHGNYPTAWFDVKNRTLGLPLWKDMGKDVYDLLVGHEVGHALYTPYEGWHDSPEKLEGCPRSYINVIEDARIERFIQRDYPGLVGPFKRGYFSLKDRGLFDYPDDQTKIKLIDKINLKAKLGEMVHIYFNKEEKEFYNRARYQTQTFEEVVELCREILAYTQENTPELIQKPQPEGDIEIPEGMEEIAGEGEAGPQTGHDDYLEEDESSSSTDGEQSSEEDEASNSSKSESEDGDKSDDRTETNNSSSESDEADTPSTEEDSNENGTKDKGEGEEDISITDENHREAERTLLEEDENGKQPVYMRGPSKKLIDHVLFPFKEVHESRQKVMESYDFDPAKSGIMEGYGEYIANVKRASNFAVKEFEMRKAGYQWQRAQTAKSGTLDVNKVYSYKYNEDIFARVTKLANAKNHGMIMLIDYSGSMSGTLGQVIDQLLHLVTFCKMVNIPFDVYAFTTGNRDLINSRGRPLLVDGDLEISNVCLPLLISSSLKKREYNQALEGLYMKKLAVESRGNYYYDRDYWDDYAVTGKMEKWGSTPLNQSLVIAHTLVKKFKMKHAVDKMNLVVLSDGDSNGLREYEDYSKYKNKGLDPRKEGLKLDRWKYRIHIEGKLLEISSDPRRSTHELLKSISKRYACTTIGFFVSDRTWDFKSKLHEADIWDMREPNKEYRKNKCVSLKNAVGYDEFYLVKGGKKLKATEDEFEVKEDASTAQIRAGFKKFSASKKKNKVLLTNFGKAVA